jgi:universal stress protein E
MIWRHVMLALPEVESVPAQLLDKVGRLVRGLQAELKVFHCFYDPQLAVGRESVTHLDELIAGRVATAKLRLERIADSLRDQNLEVRASVRFDYPIFEAVIRQVLRDGPNLLIVPATRAGHAGARAVTYTDARLIEACPCPLLLMKTEQAYSRGPIVAAIDPMHARRKPADLDEIIIGATKTLSYALSDAPVQVYHAVAPLREVVAAGAERESAVSAERQKAYFTKCEAETRKIAARYEVPESSVHVEAGAVEYVLPGYAREARADSVVMGAISRSYPECALFGHTAEKVLNALNCDVLIVKPRGFRCPVSRRPRPVTGPSTVRRRAPAVHAP